MSLQTQHALYLFKAQLLALKIRVMQSKHIHFKVSMPTGNRSAKHRAKVPQCETAHELN